MSCRGGSPSAVCGDFNTPLSSWLDNDRSVVVCPEPAQPTYPATEAVEPIDYCVASPELLMEGKVLPVGGSDHLPLLVCARLADEE
ncbi:MAG: endonuclease/exonuclease/phosphatase family protein [Pseudonocardiaceae bacterium]